MILDWGAAGNPSSSLYENRPWLDPLVSQSDWGKVVARLISPQAPSLEIRCRRRIC